MAHCFCKRNYLWFRVNAARVSVKFRVIAAYRPLVGNVSAPKTKKGLQNNLSTLTYFWLCKKSTLAVAYHTTVHRGRKFESSHCMHKCESNVVLFISSSVTEYACKAHYSPTICSVFIEVQYDHTVICTHHVAIRRDWTYFDTSTAEKGRLKYRCC